MVKSCDAMACSLGILLLLLLVFVRSSSAKPHVITDEEVLAKKADCLQDINNGLWGFHCKSTNIAKKNCVLRCVSAACYDMIYGADPLEEGEVDAKRGREFKYCIRRESRGDDISASSYFD